MSCEYWQNKKGIDIWGDITGFWLTVLGIDGIPLRENGKNKHEEAESQ